MIFETGSSIDGPYEFGYEKGWQWTKDKGGYNAGRDFFWIHWEISDSKPNRVKLHVDCPNAETDLALNTIKQEVVRDFLSSHFRRMVEKHGYQYVAGPRATEGYIKVNKSTQPFCIVLTKNQQKESNQANIEMINDVMSEAVAEVVNRYRDRLNREFDK